MKIQLFVADMFDKLSSGKILAVGMYSDQVVLLGEPGDDQEPSTERPFALTLSFLTTIWELEPGPHAVEVWLRAPDGQRQGSGPKSNTIRMIASQGQSFNLISPPTPLVITQFGEMAVVVVVDGEEFPQPFHIRPRSSISLPTAEAP